jgi:hypothetical protein
LFGIWVLVNFPSTTSTLIMVVSPVPAKDVILGRSAAGGKYAEGDEKFFHR